MTLKFKNRIALFNTLAVAFTTALVFLVIYFVVSKTAYSHLEKDILIEKEEVFNTLDWRRDSIIINKMPEWDEAEHNQIEVNPTFLQVADINGKIVFRSTNLLKDQFLNSPSKKEVTFYNGEIGGQKIRLGQFPILNEAGENIGQLTIAISQQESSIILNNLIWVLLISFPVVLIVQFVASSLAASRAIQPVHHLINSASGIGDSNMSTRLILPEHKDELYELTKTINELLARIEASMLQQKQFTSDASHEIRTPLSAIRGTLEVLIRRQREPYIYEEKVADVIAQVDRLDLLLEQLLQLARIESDFALAKNETINLLQISSELMKKWELVASKEKIKLHLNISEDAAITGDRLYMELILDNLLSNAIKYGKVNGNVFVQWNNNARTLTFKDDGIGISAENLSKIFNRFYRADESRSSSVIGNGLGLSIVKKLADLQQINLTVMSKPGAGSSFILKFIH